MDFHSLRTPEFANKVRESQKHRYRSTAIVDYVLALDDTWRKGIFTFSFSRHSTKHCFK